MGNILPSFKKALFEELIDNISSNTSHYYAFAANPIAYTGNSVPNVGYDDYNNFFVNDWYMLFGKKINSNDLALVVKKNIWANNIKYSMYNNYSNTIHIDNNFYVATEPLSQGASYYVYKCIDNANNSVSTVNPSTISNPTQSTSFITADGYKWRYLYSITSKNFEKFISTDYMPVYTNPVISSLSYYYAGVEVINIVNGGIGYSTYHDGTILANPNNSFLQIESTASKNNGFYNKNAIYIYNEFEATGQVREISNYISNSSGNFVSVTPTVNTEIISPNITKYKISPKVIFETDGDKDPIAYSTINTTSNSINGVVILDIGSNISRANVSIQGNNAFGSGANLIAIVPPPGGHGFDPPTELNVQGLVVNFTFANSESNNIITSNVVYNKIGLVKNPSSLTANVANISLVSSNLSLGTVIYEGNVYTNNIFDQILKANVGSAYVFNYGETVTGNNSGAKATVVYSNSSVVYLIGDKNFINGEYISNNAGNYVTTITINEVGDIYTKNLKPFYVENINNVNRLEDQSESFRLTIKV